MDNGDWEVADLKSILEGAVAGRAWEICECFCRVQEILRETGTEVPQNLLVLLYSLAEEPVVVPSLEITLSL